MEFCTAKPLNKNAKRFYYGAGGIRTLGTLAGHNSLAGSPIRPLSHRSKESFKQGLRPLFVSATLIKTRSVFITEQGGFGVPVANILFAPSTPASALPVHTTFRSFVVWNDLLHRHSAVQRHPCTGIFS